MNPYLIGGDALGAVSRFRRRGSPKMPGSPSTTKMSTKKTVPKAVRATVSKKLVATGDRLTAAGKKLAKRLPKTSDKLLKLGNNLYGKATNIVGGDLVYQGPVLDAQTVQDAAAMIDMLNAVALVGEIAGLVSDLVSTLFPDTQKVLIDQGNGIISRCQNIVDAFDEFAPDPNLVTKVQQINVDYHTWLAQVKPSAGPMTKAIDAGTHTQSMQAPGGAPSGGSSSPSGGGSSSSTGSGSSSPPSQQTSSPKQTPPASTQSPPANQPPSQQPPPWWSAPPPPNWTYGGGYGGYGGGYGGGGYGGGGGVYDEGGGGPPPVDESNIDWGDGSTPSPPPSPDYVDQGVDWGTAASADDGGDESADFVNQGIPDDMMGAEEKPIPWYAWAAVAVVGVIGLIGFTKTWRAQ